MGFLTLRHPFDEELHPLLVVRTLTLRRMVVACRTLRRLVGSFLRWLTALVQVQIPRKRRTCWVLLRLKVTVPRTIRLTDATGTFVPFPYHIIGLGGQEWGRITFLQFTDKPLQNFPLPPKNPPTHPTSPPPHSKDATSRPRSLRITLTTLPTTSPQRLLLL